MPPGEGAPSAGLVASEACSANPGDRQSSDGRGRTASVRLSVALERHRVLVESARELSLDSERLEVDGSGAGEFSLGALEPAGTTSADAAVDVTAQVVVQVGSAEPAKSTRSSSPFAAVNVAVPENVPAAKSTQCGYVAATRPRCELVPVNMSVTRNPHARRCSGL